MPRGSRQYSWPGRKAQEPCTFQELSAIAHFLPLFIPLWLAQRTVLYRLHEAQIMARTAQARTLALDSKILFCARFPICTQSPAICRFSLLERHCLFHAVRGLDKNQRARGNRCGDLGKIEMMKNVRNEDVGSIKVTVSHCKCSIRKKAVCADQICDAVIESSSKKAPKRGASFADQMQPPRIYSFALHRVIDTPYHVEDAHAQQRRVH